MKKSVEMLPEYDFSKGVRGKYAKEYKSGVNVVKLDDDVSAVFSDTKSVNEALRAMMLFLSESQKLIKQG